MNEILAGACVGKCAGCPRIIKGLRTLDLLQSINEAAIDSTNASDIDTFELLYTPDKDQPSKETGEDVLREIEEMAEELSSGLILNISANAIEIDGIRKVIARIAEECPGPLTTSVYDGSQQNGPHAPDFYNIVICRTPMAPEGPSIDYSLVTRQFSNIPRL